MEMLYTEHFLACVNLSGHPPDLGVGKQALKYRRLSIRIYLVSLVEN